LLAALRGSISITQGGKPFEVPFARSREVRVPRLPHMKFQELEAGRFSEAEAGVTVHVGVHNPNPFEIRISQIEYELTIAGTKIAESTIGRAEHVAPTSPGSFHPQAHVDPQAHR